MAPTSELMPHICLHAGHVQPVVLTVGAPERVMALAELCDSYEELACNREYRSMNVVAKGQKFTVISHGIGVPGAMICFEELVKVGAKVILRAGTCGSLKPDRIKAGDVYVPYAMARDPDTTDLYAPLGLPAVATPRIYQTIMKCGEELGVHLNTGVGLTNGIFYGSGPKHNEHLKMWGGLADVVEMELQSLLIVAHVRGIEAGGIVTVDGSPLQWDMGNYDPTGAKCIKGKKDMLRVAIEACILLSKEYQPKAPQK